MQFIYYEEVKEPEYVRRLYFEGSEAWRCKDELFSPMVPTPPTQFSPTVSCSFHSSASEGSMARELVRRPEEEIV